MFNQSLELLMKNAGGLCTNTPMNQVEVRPLIRVWSDAARDFFGRLMPPRQPRMSERDLTALDGLSAETLKDIGAPEWMQEGARRSANRAQQGGLFERDTINWR
jgi:hypothetical protein